MSRHPGLLALVLAVQYVICDFAVANATGANELKVFHHWVASDTRIGAEQIPGVTFTLMGSSDDQLLPILMLGWHGGEWEVMITCGQSLMPFASSVSCEWDGRGSINKSWRPSKDGKAAFATNPTEFVSRTLTAQRLRVRLSLKAQPMRELQFVFNVQGLEDEMHKFPAVTKPTKIEKILSVSEVAWRMH